MEITVQWVRTSWTKHSRGGEAAALRNAVPAGFRLPPPAPDVAHFVHMAEWNGFTPQASERPLRSVDVGLRDERGRLRVQAWVNPMSGLPPRRRRPPAVRLEPGQWVRWQLNYRFSGVTSARDWSYWLDTFNVAYGPVDRDAFLSEPPTLVDERGPLR
ncbi:hypothetical protein [Streptomyces sp. NPDC127114]|uniref:hypothetical protein n=1 Tax=Streptomyces sp. NPDC127114 TaxID=3345366 RepID=UPI00362BE8DA